MVDFNNETTATITPSALVKILILQRRHDFLEAQEHYYKYLSDDVETPVSLDMVLARLRTLFLELQPMLKRQWKGQEEELEEFKKIFTNDSKEKNSIEKILNHFVQLNAMLDAVGLLKIDNKKAYDTTSWEESNNAFKI